MAAVLVERVLVGLVPPPWCAWLVGLVGRVEHAVVKLAGADAYA